MVVWEYQNNEFVAHNRTGCACEPCSRGTAAVALMPFVAAVAFALPLLVYEVAAVVFPSKERVTARAWRDRADAPSRWFVSAVARIVTWPAAALVRWLRGRWPDRFRGVTPGDGYARASEAYASGRDMPGKYVGTHATWAGLAVTLITMLLLFASGARAACPVIDGIETCSVPFGASSSVQGVGTLTLSTYSVLVYGANTTNAVEYFVMPDKVVGVVDCTGRMPVAAGNAVAASGSWDSAVSMTIPHHECYGAAVGAGPTFPGFTIVVSLVVVVCPPQTVTVPSGQTEWQWQVPATGVWDAVVTAVPVPITVACLNASSGYRCGSTFPGLGGGAGTDTILLTDRGAYGPLDSIPSGALTLGAVAPPNEVLSEVTTYIQQDPVTLEPAQTYEVPPNWLGATGCMTAQVAAGGPTAQTLFSNYSAAAESFALGVPPTLNFPDMSAVTETYGDECARLQAASGDNLIMPAIPVAGLTPPTAGGLPPVSQSITCDSPDLSESLDVRVPVLPPINDQLTSAAAQRAGGGTPIATAGRLSTATCTVTVAEAPSPPPTTLAPGAPPPAAPVCATVGNRTCCTTTGFANCTYVSGEWPTYAGGIPANGWLPPGWPPNLCNASVSRVDNYTYRVNTLQENCGYAGTCSVIDDSVSYRANSSCELFAADAAYLLGFHFVPSGPSTHNQTVAPTFVPETMPPSGSDCGVFDLSCAVSGTADQVARVMAILAGVAIALAIVCVLFCLFCR